MNDKSMKLLWENNRRSDSKNLNLVELLSSNLWTAHWTLAATKFNKRPVMWSTHIMASYQGIKKTPTAT